jgi:hypothetical protein
MRLHSLVATVGMLSALTACQRDAAPRIDDTLRQDLSLAAAVQPYAPQQFMSPVEQGYGYAPQGYYAPRAPAPVVYRSAPRVIRRAPAPAPVYDNTEGNGSGVYSEEVVVKKNTKRDAIIGAAAGAAIGAVSTRDRVKGAIIGAAAGGILGAIIGEKVDVQRTRIPR